jgi:hypothetical protein
MEKLGKADTALGDDFALRSDPSQDDLYVILTSVYVP